MASDRFRRWCEMCRKYADTQVVQLAGKRLVDLRRIARDWSAGYSKTQFHGTEATCASVCTS